MTVGWHAHALFTLSSLKLKSSVNCKKLLKAYKENTFLIFYDLFTIPTFGAYN